MHVLHRPIELANIIIHMIWALCHLRICRLPRSPATAQPVEPSGPTRLPALLAHAAAAERRVIEFFTAHIRNPNTRKQSVAAD